MQAARSKPTTKLKWRRPVREAGTVGTWRRYLSACGQYRVSVRVSGPGCTPARFYAERLNDSLSGWTIIGSRHRTKAAAMKACERMSDNAWQFFGKQCPQCGNALPKHGLLMKCATCPSVCCQACQHLRSVHTFACLSHQLGVHADAH